MDAMVDAFRDPAFRNLYVYVGFALMILPMIALSWWYHRNINKTAGGRELMKRQNASRPFGRSVRPAHDLATGRAIMRDIASGEYGDRPRVMQNRVYWFMAIYVVVLALYFGFLMWADEVNRVVT